VHGLVVVVFVVKGVTEVFTGVTDVMYGLTAVLTTVNVIFSRMLYGVPVHDGPVPSVATFKNNMSVVPPGFAP